MAPLRCRRRVILGHVSIGINPTATATRTPSTTPVVSPTATATATATATTIPASGDLCLQMYNDPNRNGSRDAGESLVAGGMITVTDILSNVVATYTTTGVSEPHCVSLPPAVYYVQEKPPAGYAGAIPSLWKVALVDDDVIQTSFGVVRSDAIASVPAVTTNRGDSEPGLSACGTQASFGWSPSSRSVNFNSTFTMDIFVTLSGGGEADGADVTFTWNQHYLHCRA